MNLSELNKNNKYATDKNTVHSYVDNLYDSLFEQKRLTASRVLEIGVYDGGSILLWRDYFINAIIDAIDINDCSTKIDNHRINNMVCDAYNLNTIKKLQEYDIIIDDGPHTIDSMVFFIKHYIHLLKPEGIAVIEDIQDYRWIDTLVKLIPDSFTSQIVDLRPIKNRYDDLLLVIRK